MKKDRSGRLVKALFVLGGIILIIASFLNEFLDLPSLIFNEPATPINLTEILIECSIILLVSVILGIPLSRLLKERQSLIKKIQDKADQKEVLLKESHHRIKNDLFLLTSSIKLAQLNTDATKNDCIDSILNRINAIAVMHQEFAISGSKEIDCYSFIQQIFEYLLKAYEVKINLKLKIDKMVLQGQVLTSLALILSELFTNAIKHSLLLQDNPCLWVECKKRKDIVVLIVGNSGEFKSSPDVVQNGTSLGMTILRELVGQLEGNMSLDLSRGVEFIIQFPSESFLLNN